MIMLLKFKIFPDELSKNDELREFELSGSDYFCRKASASKVCTPLGIDGAPLHHMVNSRPATDDSIHV